MRNHQLSTATLDHPLDYSEDTRATKSARTIPIVCLGMSAGGLSPLKTIVKKLSSDTGMAFVVITHFGPNYKTHLPDLLSRWSEMPVQLVERGLVIRPNHVYIIPPGKELIVRDGWFSTTPRSRYPNVITLFLDSLTVHRKPPGIAVILSGMDSDGADALPGFGRAGGIVIAQRPDSAEYEDMPRSAIRTGFVNYVLSPEEIPGHIELLGRQLTSGEAAVLQSS
jgi:chemotaxis response regulator CheB